MHAYHLNERFQEIVTQHAANVALKFSNKEYTYLELNHDANLIASQLHQEGVKRGDVIAIINSKAYLSYALMVACIKLGVIYTNIDPQSPKVRFESIIQQCQPVRIYTDHECKQEMHDASYALGCTPILNISDFMDSARQSLPQEIIHHLDGDAIAYIMFTSGSTGQPKGVAISHQNLLHFIHWSTTKYQIAPQDILANVNPMHFDNSVFDFYTALFSGACLVPVSQAITAIPNALVQYIDDMHCTVWFSVPSLLIYLMTMRALNNNNFTHIRVITFGGEGYPKIELKKLYDLYKDRIRFVNVYGPTECTCICSSYDLSDNDFADLEGLPPLGYMNPNFSFVIQNDDQQPDIQGELCLLGPNVGRGYYHHHDATKKAFCEYSGNGYYFSRMYRSGDTVKLQNGLLYFLGRKDNQIKHMGHRIELEEIEGAINLIPGITQAAVVYQRIKSTYGKIIAYAASTARIDAQMIQDKLKPILPSYMIPNKIVVLDHLPKNQNGKIDKRAILELIEVETID
jgi:amino acid adenylation domain-containing protein